MRSAYLRRMRKIPQLLLAVALAAALTMGLVPGTSSVPGASSTFEDAPAGAGFYYHPVNQITSQALVINGCYMRLWYGNFGSSAFAKIRYYGGSTCGTMHPEVIYDDGGGSRTWDLWDPSAPGTDGCGSYFEAQSTYPNPAFATGMWVIGGGVAHVFGSTYTASWSPTSPC